MKWLVAISFFLIGVACASHDVHPIVSGNSVGDIVIGRAPPKIDSRRLVLRQWQQDENGDSYELIRLKVRDAAVDAEVYDGKVWRISIDQPELLTEDHVGVGSKAMRLLKANTTIQPRIGPGPMIVLVPVTPCGISYLTDAELPDLATQELSRDSVAPLLSDAGVTSILVVGCSK